MYQQVLQTVTWPEDVTTHAARHYRHLQQSYIKQQTPATNSHQQVFQVHSWPGEAATHATGHYRQKKKTAIQQTTNICHRQSQPLASQQPVLHTDMTRKKKCNDTRYLSLSRLATNSHQHLQQSLTPATKSPTPAAKSSTPAAKSSTPATVTSRYSRFRRGQKMKRNTLPAIDTSNICLFKCSFLRHFQLFQVNLTGRKIVTAIHKNTPHNFQTERNVKFFVPCLIIHY